jgi:putative alpha-1,2-mannosidase
MFPSAAIHMGNGSTLSIHSTGNGPYVKQVLFDGQENNSSWIPVSALNKANSRLEFTLSPEPNKQRGLPAIERPPTWVNPTR